MGWGGRGVCIQHINTVEFILKQRADLVQYDNNTTMNFLYLSISCQLFVLK